MGTSFISRTFSMGWSLRYGRSGSRTDRATYQHQSDRAALCEGQGLRCTEGEAGSEGAFSMKVSLSQHRVSILCICHVNNHGYSGTITKLILSQFSPEFLFVILGMKTNLQYLVSQTAAFAEGWFDILHPLLPPPYSSQYVQD